MASVGEEVEVDHISRLPAAIIHHIFSFLPFKDVVKTSVLSKQWRFTWTSTPYIHLSLPSAVVVPSIGRALRLCTATKIEKFHLHTTMTAVRVPTELDWWFRFAAGRKVEDVSLAFGYWFGDVPRILCDCASLVSLRLSYCFFSWDFTIHWPSLKKLCIHDVRSDNDKIMKILSGCPALESLTLRLRFSVGNGNLRIDSRSLRELVIEAVFTSHFSCSVDILAPNLLSLRLLGGYSLIGFGPNGVSPLAEVELNFDEPTGFCGHLSDQLKFLLKQLQHVAKITIASWCLKVLSAAEGHLSSRWRNIIVYTSVCKCDLLGMAYLLQSSPLLERLVICNPKFNKFAFKYQDFPELSNFDEKQFWRSQKEVYCVVNHLKRVEIVGFEFDDKKSKLLLALAKFLLQEAAGLEKMIIDAELRKSRRGVPVAPHDLIQLQEGCWRVSRKAQVIVNYRFHGLPYESCKHKQSHKHWYRNKIARLFLYHF